MGTRKQDSKTAIIFLLAMALVIVWSGGCQQQPRRIYKVAATSNPKNTSLASASNPYRAAGPTSHRRSSDTRDASNASKATTPNAPTIPPATEGISANSLASTGMTSAETDNPVNKQKLPTSDYHIGSGDELQINIYQLLELEKEEQLSVKVDREGEINLPVLNHIQVAGMTCQQLQGELTSRLGRDYIRDPKVSVNLKSYGSKQVMVLGSVQRAGVLSLPSDSSTLLDVISQAGGVSQTSAPFVEILRGAFDPVNGASMVPASILKNATGYAREVVALSQLFAQDGKAVNPVIYPGDVVSVPSGDEGYVYISGEVEQPGAKPFRRPLTLLQAVATAGGPNSVAAENKCRIVRRTPEGQERVIIVNIAKIREGTQPNLMLARNDTIIVPTDPTKKFFQDLGRFIRGGVNGGVNATYDAGSELGFPRSPYGNSGF